MSEQEMRPAPEPWPGDDDEYEARITRMRVGYSVHIHRGLMGYRAGWFAWTKDGAHRKATRVMRRLQRKDDRERAADVIRLDG